MIKNIAITALFMICAVQFIQLSNKSREIEDIKSTDSVIVRSMVNLPRNIKYIDWPEEILALDSTTSLSGYLNHDTLSFVYNNFLFLRVMGEDGGTGEESNAIRLIDSMNKIK